MCRPVVLVLASAMLIEQSGTAQRAPELEPILVPEGDRVSSLLRRLVESCRCRTAASTRGLPLHDAVTGCVITVSRRLRSSVAPISVKLVPRNAGSADEPQCAVFQAIDGCSAGAISVPILRREPHADTQSRLICPTRAPRQRLGGINAAAGEPDALHAEQSLVELNLPARRPQHLWMPSDKGSLLNSIVRPSDAPSRCRSTRRADEFTTRRRSGSPATAIAADDCLANGPDGDSERSLALLARLDSKR
jgi:hypothetical protein